MPEATTNIPAESLGDLQAQMQQMSEKLSALAAHNTELITAAPQQPFLITGLTVFVLACFVGYHVVWRVTPALHSPLMGITNAISSVIIVGAIMALWPVDGSFSLMGFIAVILASVNIFGGFIITQRMLAMFKKKGS